MVIPGAASGLAERLHRRMLVAQIRRAIRAVDPRRRMPLQIWTFAPDVPYLQGKFDEECFLYYCVDEYTEFEGFDTSRIKASEDELIDRADIVITTSESLLDTKGARRPDALLVNHGVDFDHFARAWRVPPQPPDDLATIPRPIFGFFGLIHHWVDVALLAKVAEMRPYHSFVLIGDCCVDVGELQRQSNVFLLGRRPYEDLPAYCAAFDAGLLLFSRSAMTQNVNPIKMYEYLAAGLPVISTSIPEARRFEGPIALADTAEEFARACDRAVELESTGRREMISRVVESETWLSRVEYLSDAVMNHVNGSPRSTTFRTIESGAQRTALRQLATLAR
jgi:glycosyltransferase involved in cell wall biosynthesis